MSHAILDEEDLYPGPQSEPFVMAEQSEIEQVGEGIRRQFLGFNDQIMAVRVWFDKGAVGDVHTHYHSQVSYVESGEFDVSVNGEIKTLKSGDSFYVVPHAPHGAVCKREGVLIDMFAPMREDFLGKVEQS